MTIKFLKLVSFIFLFLLINITSPLIAQNTFTLSNNNLTGMVQSTADVADIDGDNDLDLIISGLLVSLGFPSTIEMYTNDGNGNFTKVENTPFVPIHDGSIKFLDIDGDNDQDVLIVGYSFYLSPAGFVNTPTAELYTNDGNGNFTQVTGTPFIPSQYNAIAIADVDQDTDLDIYITAGNSSSFYINDGTGVFTIGASLTALSFGSAIFGDINGDTYPDLLQTGRAAGSYHSELYTNDGAGNFTLVTGTPFSEGYRTAIDMADINGDTYLDIFISGQLSETNSSSFAELYTNDGSGNFTLVNNTAFQTGPRAMVAFEDVDNDGDQDAYYSSYTSLDLRAIYLNDGTGIFYEDNSHTASLMTNGKVLFFDADGDNDKDLFAMGQSWTSGTRTLLYKNEIATQANKAIDFDGVNHCTAAHHDSLNQLPLTIEFWAKTPPGDTEISFIKKTNGADNEFNIYTSAGVVHANYSIDASNHTSTQSAAALNDDQWHHIAFVVDGTDSKLYIDGVLEQTSIWTGTSSAISNTNDLIMGLGTAVFNGQIDEIRIWNTIRTQLEIREQMYSAITQPLANSNLITYYSMNAFTDNVFYDLSKLYNPGTIPVGPLVKVDELITFSATTTSIESSVQNSTTTIGDLLFDDATANGNDPFDNSLEVVVAKVTGAPNTTAGITQSFIDSKYYVVQLYGAAGTFDLSLSIACDFPNGSAVTLYRRDDHSMGNWMVSSTGTVTNGKAVFNGITSFSQLVVASGVALPVDLISFSARQAEEQVRLDWATASETNNKGFEIERLDKENDRWTSIGFENGAGDSDVEIFYTFYDQSPLIGRNYYRINQVDFDGTSTLSEVRVVEFKIEQNQTVMLYPNPASSVINIESDYEGFEIQIFSSLGQLILTSKNEKQIDVSNFISGTYYFKIYNRQNNSYEGLCVEIMHK